MSEQSLFRRFAPYKPYSGRHQDATKKQLSKNDRLKVKCGVRIIKFHNTIFSDIKICLLAEA